MKSALLPWVALSCAAAGSLSGAAPFARDLSTDRPDATESPYTVEKGRWQIETEPLRWSRDREDGVRVDTFTAGAFNLKYGLTESSDLQFVFAPYSHARVRTAGVSQTFDGVGDTVVRLKINLQGNDTPGLAWGLMPFVKLPTAGDDLGNGHLEGGMILPLAFALNDRWGCGLMAEVDIVRHDANDGYRAAVITTATIATNLAEPIGWFLELANEATGGHRSDWAMTFNTGLTFALAENQQIDAGVNIGLTEAAEDFAAFLGFSARW